MTTIRAAMLAAATALAATGALANPPRGLMADFSEGTQGWEGPQGIGGATAVDPDVGHPAPALHTRFEDFGIEFANSRPQWVAGLHRPGAVEIGLRTNTYSVFFFSREVTRTLVVEIRDHHNPPDGYPYVAVWAPIGTLDAANAGWKEMRLRIPDTGATALPAGWGGYGAEDPDTFAPMLPPGRTFADVLANADEIAFTTVVPGWLFAMASFDVAIDNVYLRRVRQQP